MKRSLVSDLDRSYSINLVKKYSKLIGAEQIASQISIETLLTLIREKTPKHVLELGAGIGTLTELFLVKTEGDLTSIETNEWCVAQLQRNTIGLRKFVLEFDYGKLDFGTSADFLCIDVNSGIVSVEKLIANSANLKTVFIEGHHLAHRINISKQIWKNGKLQRFYDVREARGKKGCAYFEIIDDLSFGKWQTTGTFILVYKSFLISNLLLKVRKRLGIALNYLERVPGVSLIRSLWKGKIPWNF